jgi:hypothetical protein
MQGKAIYQQIASFAISNNKLATYQHRESRCNQHSLTGNLLHFLEGMVNRDIQLHFFARDLCRRTQKSCPKSVY